MTALLRSLTPERIIGQGLKVLAIVIAAVLVHLAIRAALRRAARRIGHARSLPPDEGRRLFTLLGLVSNAAGYFIFVVAALMALRELGVNTAAILAGAAIPALAVGFGAQNLVRDIVSGFFILFERQYSVGDTVQINSVRGTIEDVGLRVTRLRDSDGVIHWFANGAITAVSTFPAAQKQEP